MSESAHQPADDTCAPVAPQVLPDGSRPGAARRDGRTYVWGRGTAEVWLRADSETFGPVTEPGDVTSHRLGPVDVLLVGDEGVGMVAGMFSLAGCDYTVWLAGGTTYENATAYLAEDY